MVQRDQNRVVLGAVAAAGFMFVLYIIGKKLTRRKAGKGESSQQQPQGSVELDKSSKILSEAAPLTQDSQTMSAPATASAAQPTAVESESTSSSSSQAPRTREGSMFYDSYGGYQRTHTADTMSLSKQGDRKSVMAETMSDFKSPRVSWYSGDARKGEADGTDGGGMGAGGMDEAPMVAEKAQKQEANTTAGQAGREFGVEKGREAGGATRPAPEALEEEEAGDGPVFKPAWMKKSSKTAGSASAASSRAVANGQQREDTQLGRASSEHAAAAPPAAAAAPPAASLDMGAVTVAIMTSQSRPDKVTEKDVTTLVSCLQQPNPSLLLTALSCISRCANFTQNQRLLREAGCVERLQALLETHGPDARARVTTDEAILSSTLNVITNMATDLENQARLEVCLQPLLELVLSGELSQETSLSALRVLTNLSVTSAFHGHYTRGVQQLYSLLQSSAPSLQLQLLRILVNLSCNPDMAPHLLAAKAPENLLSLLEADETSGLPLRVVTFLANVEAVVQDQGLTPSALPTLDKAASPETLFAIMHGQLSRGNLRSKVFRLTSSADEDVAHHSRRLYSSLGAT